MDLMLCRQACASIADLVREELPGVTVARTLTPDY